MSSEIVRTAIIGGDPLFREGLRRVLQDTRYRVELVARTLDEVAAHRAPLDLLLLLTFSSEPQFLDTLSALRRHRPQAYVVTIAENRADQLIAALKADIHSYLARYVSGEALLRFLSLIVLGQRVFTTRSLDLAKPFDQGTMQEDAAQAIGAERGDCGALTQRERVLLTFLVEGQSNKMIARKLGIAEATVKAQMAKLFDKIGAVNRTQAAVLAWAAQRASPFGLPNSAGRSDMKGLS